jgi:hypothetical protein
VCRGKYTSKHGDSSRQLCTCKSAALETIEHFYFECAAYAAVRQPLTDAATEWCKLSAEHTPDMLGGCRQALLWAAKDSQLLTPNGPNTAGGDLRKRALGFYAKAKAIRHAQPQQVHGHCCPAHAKRLAPRVTGISMAMPSWRYRPRPSGRQFHTKKVPKKDCGYVYGVGSSGAGTKRPRVADVAEHAEVAEHVVSIMEMVRVNVDL